MPIGTKAITDSVTSPWVVPLDAPFVSLPLLSASRSLSAGRTDSASMSAPSGLGLQPLSQGRLIFANRRLGVEQPSLSLRIQALAVRCSLRLSHPPPLPSCDFPFILTKSGGVVDLRGVPLPLTTVSAGELTRKPSHILLSLWFSFWCQAQFFFFQFECGRGST